MYKLVDSVCYGDSCLDSLEEFIRQCDFDAIEKRLVLTIDKLRKNRLYEFRFCSCSIEYNSDLHRSVFINRLSKENRIGANTAVQWFRLFKDYMVLISVYFLCNINLDKTALCYLLSIAPYQVIQVWKQAVLYTKAYHQFNLAFLGLERPFDLISIDKITESELYNGNCIPFERIYETNRKILNSKSLHSGILAYSANIHVLQSIVMLQDNSQNLNEAMLKRILNIGKPPDDYNCIAYHMKQIKVNTATNRQSSNFTYLLETDYSQDVLELIDRINSNPLLVLSRMKCTYSLDLDTFISYVKAYKQFLTLIGLNQIARRNLMKEISLCPSELVDQVWHFHQMNLTEYEKDCNWFFGFTLFHGVSTWSEEDNDKYRCVYASTLLALEQLIEDCDWSVWVAADVRFTQGFCYWSCLDFGVLRKCVVGFI